MKIRGFRNIGPLILLAGLNQISTGGEMGKKGILDVIHGMRSVSIDEVAVQDLFGAKIDNTRNNGYLAFYEGTGPRLDDGVKISKFGFMKANDGTTAPWVYMDIEGQCVSLDDIKKAYPDLTTRNPVPSPHTLMVRYVSENDYSEMSFAFKVDSPTAPRCLVNVGFSPKNLKSNPALTK